MILAKVCNCDQSWKTS